MVSIYVHQTRVQVTSAARLQTPYLDLNLVALFKLFHLTVLVAQLRSSILQLLLTDLPEGIDLVLHTQTHCPR